MLPQNFDLTQVHITESVTRLSTQHPHYLVDFRPRIHVDPSQNSSSRRKKCH